MTMFLILAVVVWGVALGVWYVVSKYLRSFDSVRINERLVGLTKGKKKSKDAV